MARAAPEFRGCSADESAEDAREVALVREARLERDGRQRLCRRAEQIRCDLDAPPAKEMPHRAAEAFSECGREMRRMDADTLRHRAPRQRVDRMIAQVVARDLQ